MSILLSCQDLSKTFGARALFAGVSMGISANERLGLIGPNGSGKSTLLKLLAGLEVPDTGKLTTRKDLHFGYVPQAETFEPGSTPLSVVTAAVLPQMHDEHDAAVQAMMALSRAGFEDVDKPTTELSGGWRKRLAIARELAREPDLLLMDEPTNHLDLEGIFWLEDLLRSASFAVIVVTHDRYFLEAVATRVLELSRAYPEGTFTVQGSYSEFLVRRAEFLEAQAKQEQSLAGKVRTDIAWLNRGAKARRTKAKGRIEEAGQRMAELAELRQRNAPNKSAGIDFSGTGRKTTNLLVGHNLSKSLAGRTLFSKLDLTLSPGTRLGLLGPNGSGKTTLIRLLTGEVTPDTGTIKRADKLRVVTFTQNRAELDPRQSLREALCPLGDTVIYCGQSMHIHTWARRFLFSSEQLKVSVGDLSGGEQARILIARLMLLPADLLILDEPTNDLDIPSLEVLEESLAEFPGAVLLVTHDRFLLDRLSNQILSLDGSGGAHMYADYPQWESAQEAKEAAAQPKPAAAVKPQAASDAKPQTKRLTYDEKREFAQIEAKILTAEAEVKTLEAKLNEPNTLADHALLQESCRALGAAHTLVAKLYERWADLESRQG